jgi:hypothetical protein
MFCKSPITAVYLRYYDFTASQTDLQFKSNTFLKSTISNITPWLQTYTKHTCAGACRTKRNTETEAERKEVNAQAKTGLKWTTVSTMAQAVCRLTLTAKVRVRCGICGGSSGTGIRFPFSTSVSVYQSHLINAPYAFTYHQPGITVASGSVVKQHTQKWDTCRT